MRLTQLAPHQFTKDGVSVTSDGNITEITQMHVLTPDGFQRQTVESMPKGAQPIPKSPLTARASG